MPEFAVELADIDQTRPDRAVDDRHFVGFAGFVVGQRRGRLGHWMNSFQLDLGRRGPGRRFRRVRGHPNKPPPEAQLWRPDRYFAARSRAGDPAVDGGQAEADQGHSGELSRSSRRSPRNGGAEQDGGDRYQECNEQQVGRAGGGKDAEIEHVGERRRQQREAGERRPGRRPTAARQVQGRSTISMIGRINMALAVTCPAAACSGAHAHAPGSGGRRCRRRRRRARRPGRRSGPRVLPPEIGPDQDGDTGQARPARRRPSRTVIRSSRVRTWATTTVKSGVVAFRIEARPEVIVRLAPEDQAEGQGVVEGAHDEELTPGRAAPPQARPMAEPRC